VGLEQLSHTRLGISLALGVGRLMPPAIGLRIASGVAGRMARDPEAEAVRAFRDNQWVVSGRTLSAEELDDVVREVFAMSGRFFYDLYHALGSSRSIMRHIHVDDAFTSFVERAERETFVYAGLHTGNFDLMGLALASAGWNDVQVISVPDPTGGNRLQNALRSSGGFEVTPASLHSIKRATQNLAAGRSVLTGIDRPLAESRERVTFFGEAATLPVVHVRLAMRASVPVVVLCSVLHDDGKYHLHVSEPIEMEAGKGHEVVRRNAERCLASAEEFVRLAPTQWVMPHRVWPDVTAP